MKFLGLLSCFLICWCFAYYFLFSVELSNTSTMRRASPLAIWKFGYDTPFLLRWDLIFFLYFFYVSIYFSFFFFSTEYVFFGSVILCFLFIAWYAGNLDLLGNESYFFNILSKFYLVLTFLLYTIWYDLLVSYFVSFFFYSFIILGDFFDLYFIQLFLKLMIQFFFKIQLFFFKIWFKYSRSFLMVRLLFTKHTHKYMVKFSNKYSKMVFGFFFKLLN